MIPPPDHGKDRRSSPLRYSSKRQVERGLTGCRPETMLTGGAYRSQWRRLAMVGAGSPRARIVLSPEEGKMVWFGGLGVRFMISGPETGVTFALVDHPIEPPILA